MTAGGSTPIPSQRDPAEVARACLVKAIEHLDFTSSCLFCGAGPGGDDDGDGGDKLHGEECPFDGYDLTVDVDRLREFAGDP